MSLKVTSIMTTNDKDLIKRMMQSIHKTGEKKELDVYVLLGIRETHRRVEDKSLTSSERTNYKRLIDAPKGCPVDKSLRQVWCNLENGEFSIDCDGWTTNIAVALSRQYPEAVINLVTRERYETSKQDVTVEDYDEYDDYHDYDDFDTLEIYYSITDGHIASHTCYSVGMQYAENGMFNEAISILWPLAKTGDVEAMCNIGVCYERINDYEEAGRCYVRSDCNMAKLNLLKLYDNKRIAFNQDEYVKACDFLTNHDDWHGYLYMCYMHQDYYEGLENGEKALEYVRKAIETFGRNEQLTFEEAFVLNAYARNQEDYKQSHSLYERLIKSESESGFSTTAKYNYALQCRLGNGCDKNIELAIYWLIRAAMHKYHDAYVKLIDIYENEEGYVSPSNAEVWKKLLNEVEGLEN